MNTLKIYANLKRKNENFLNNQRLGVYDYALDYYYEIEDFLKQILDEEIEKNKE